MNLKKALIILLIVLSAAGCAVREERPQPFFTQRELFDKLISTLDLSHIKTLTADIRVSLFSKNIHRGTFRGYLLYKKNHGLFCPVTGPFGMRVAEVLIRDQLLELFLPSSNRVYYAYCPVESILPDREKIKESPYRIKETQKGLELLVINRDVNSSELSRVYLFKREPLFWKAVRVYTKGGGIFNIKIKDRVNGVPVDFSITWGDYLVKVSLRNVKTNSSLKDSVFTRDYPVQRLPLTELLRAL